MLQPMGAAYRLLLTATALKLLTSFERLLALHVQELCADAEPVAHMWQHEETGHIGFVENLLRKNKSTGSE